MPCTSLNVMAAVCAPIGTVTCKLLTEASYAPLLGIASVYLLPACVFSLWAYLGI